MLNIDLCPIRQSETHLCKLAEALTWFIRSRGFMKCHVRMVSVGGSESQCQLAVTESTRRESGPHSRLLSTPCQETEEVQSGILKIAQRVLIKRSYRSI